MVRPEGFEPPTPWFVAKYSIQMSYGRLRERIISEAWHVVMGQDHVVKSGAGRRGRPRKRLPFSFPPTAENAPTSAVFAGRNSIKSIRTRKPEPGSVGKRDAGVIFDARVRPKPIR